MRDLPRLIAAEVFPFDDELDGAAIDSMLYDLAEHRDHFVDRYEVDGRGFIAIREFLRLQKPHVNEAESELPSLEEATSTNVRSGLDQCTTPLAPKRERDVTESPQALGVGFKSQSSGNGEGEARGRGPKPKPARRCPPDFELSPELRAFAVTEGLDPPGVAREWGKFRDHEFQRPRSDWAAAWRNWVRRASETGGVPSMRSPPQRWLSPGEETVKNLRQVLGEYAELDAAKEAES